MAPASPKLRAPAIFQCAPRLKFQSPVDRRQTALPENPPSRLAIRIAYAQGLIGIADQGRSRIWIIANAGANRSGSVAFDAGILEVPHHS